MFTSMSIDNKQISWLANLSIIMKKMAIPSQAITSHNATSNISHPTSDQSMVTIHNQYDVSSNAIGEKSTKPTEIQNQQAIVWQHRDHNNVTVTSRLLNKVSWNLKISILWLYSDNFHFYSIHFLQHTAQQHNTTSHRLNINHLQWEFLNIFNCISQLYW